MYGYYKCRNCGQNLDPGEKCDCELEHEQTPKAHTTTTENSEPPPEVTTIDRTTCI